MANTLQILCINKSDRPNIHERIQYVGGINPNGTRWKLSRLQKLFSLLLFPGAGRCV